MWQASLFKFYSLAGWNITGKSNNTAAQLQGKTDDLLSAFQVGVTGWRDKMEVYIYLCSQYIINIALEYC